MQWRRRRDSVHRACRRPDNVSSRLRHHTTVSKRSRHDRYSEYLNENPCGAERRRSRCAAVAPLRLGPVTEEQERSALVSWLKVLSSISKSIQCGVGIVSLGSASTKHRRLKPSTYR